MYFQNKIYEVILTLELSKFWGSCWILIYRDMIAHHIKCMYGMVWFYILICVVFEMREKGTFLCSSYYQDDNSAFRIILNDELLANINDE